MKTYIFNDLEYKITKEYKDGFEEDEVRSKCTDYFKDYDYIFGDWAYGKLRLKGFCNKGNSIYKKINDIKRLDSYIKEDCAYECRYFLLEKIM